MLRTMAPPSTRKGTAVEHIPQAVIVSVNQTWPDVATGGRTPEEACREEWVIAEHRVDAIEILIAVFRGRVVGVWGVANHSSQPLIGEGKSRAVNRVTFELKPAPEWDHLVRSEAFTNRQTPQFVPLADLPAA